MLRIHRLPVGRHNGGLDGFYRWLKASVEIKKRFYACNDVEKLFLQSPNTSDGMMIQVHLRDQVRTRLTSGAQVVNTADLFAQTPSQADGLRCRIRSQK